MQNRKRVLLIGANGRIGQHITKHLIKHFHVRALIRSPPKFGINSIFLKFVQGDAMSRETLEQHLEGVDIVVASFGGDPAAHEYERFIETVIAAMKSKNVNRLITVAGVGCLKTAQHERFAESPHFPGIYKSISDDHWAAIKKLRASGLQYTVVCPPVVTPEDHDGEYDVTVGTYTHGAHKFEVKGGNIGHWVTKEAQENAHVGQLVGLFQKLG